MIIALSPQIIPIPWSDYLTGNYDRALIPCPRYRSFKYVGCSVGEYVSIDWRMLGNLNTVHRCQGLISSLRKRAKVYDFRVFAQGLDNTQISIFGST